MEPDMKTMPLSEVKTKHSELVDAVERRDEAVTITRNGDTPGSQIFPIRQWTVKNHGRSLCNSAINAQPDMRKTVEAVLTSHDFLG